MQGKTRLNRKKANYLEGFHVEVCQGGSMVVIMIPFGSDGVGRDCAGSLFSILVKESPPDPEDEEATELEPEEVMIDAEGGNEV